MQDISSKKSILIALLLLVIGGTIVGVFYSMKKAPPGEVVTPISTESESIGLSEFTRENKEIIKKEMSIATSTGGVTSTLSVQQAKKLKAAASALPNAPSSIKSSERQSLLESMSVK